MQSSQELLFLHTSRRGVFMDSWSGLRVELVRMKAGVVFTTEACRWHASISNFLLLRIVTATCLVLMGRVVVVVAFVVLFHPS